MKAKVFIQIAVLACSAVLLALNFGAGRAIAGARDSNKRDIEAYFGVSLPGLRLTAETPPAR